MSPAHPATTLSMEAPRTHAPADGSPPDPTPQRALVRLLQAAHAGELAASLAYEGHRLSLRNPDQAEGIERVRQEELHHRRRVAAFLAELDAAPDPARERRFRLIGTFLGHACRFSGWLLPMVGAGWLESHNVREYEQAARLALAAGRPGWTDELLTMAEVEWDHERLFRDWIRAHPLWKHLPLWRAPAPRATLRARFREESGPDPDRPELSSSS